MTSSTTQKLDFSKPITTRDGRPVRILCTDRKGGDYSVVGLILTEKGEEYISAWLSSGLSNRKEDSPSDLINPKVVRYYLVWRDRYRALCVTHYDSEPGRDSGARRVLEVKGRVIKTFEV